MFMNLVTILSNINYSVILSNLPVKTNVHGEKKRLVYLLANEILVLTERDNKIRTMH